MHAGASGMSGIGKRLDALEAIAEECRRREQRDVIRASILHRHTAAGLSIGSEQLDRKTERTLALAERMAQLATGGFTLDQAVQCVAIEHDLDPERVLTIFYELRAECGRAR
jgi:hypothetical protein